MTTRTPPSPLGTEKLLGPWSMTALAALLVVGGLLAMIPGKAGAGDGDGSANSLHPQVRGPAIEGRTRAPAAPATKPVPPAVQAAQAAVAESGANAELLTSDEHQAAGSILTTPDQ